MITQQWKPGGTASGVLIADGKQIWITIYPDGTMDEREYAMDERPPFMSITTLEEVAALEWSNKGMPKRCVADLAAFWYLFVLPLRFAFAKWSLVGCPELRGSGVRIQSG